MIYTLPPLPYAYEALEPYIDTRTMEIHHKKHHQAYIDNLNAALEKHPEVQKIPLKDLLADLTRVPEDIRVTVRNNGGGHENHSFFWKCMKPGGSDIPQALKKAIENAFGSLDAFKEQFAAAAKGRFGSGWAWLVLDKNKKGVPLVLKIISSANQDSPLSEGYVPLLGLDVWEHAYYLHYQNRRIEYIDAWWHVVDWNFVNERYDEAR